MADMQTVKYFNLVDDEDDIERERVKWSRAGTFSYNRNVIGLAVAYASAIRTHLSVRGTAHPMSATSVCPRSAADCLIRSAVDISHPRQQGNPPAGSFAANSTVRRDIINGLQVGAGAVGGGDNYSLCPSMATGVVPASVDSASVPLSSGRSKYLLTDAKSSIVSQRLFESLGLWSLLLL